MWCSEVFLYLVFCFLFCFCFEVSIGVMSALAELLWKASLTVSWAKRWKVLFFKDRHRFFRSSKLLKNDHKDTKRYFLFKRVVECNV